jgi:Spx/MgsR family transcriptional regulator
MSQHLRIFPYVAPYVEAITQFSPENTKMITLFGIPNCDTVKKARVWLTANGLDYKFHDFKKQGVPPERLNAWIDAVGWEKLLNSKGTTWRKLDAATQSTAVDAESAAKLLILNASLIKRPVVEWVDMASKPDISVGFDAESWAKRV